MLSFVTPVSNRTPSHYASAWLRRLGLVAVTLALWFAAMNLPVPPDTGLDRSWQTALADAHVQGRQFGPEIIFTYGPWGFLALDGFLPAALKAKLIWEILGRLAFSLTIVLLSAALPGLRRWIFLGALIAAACFFETSVLVIIALLALIWLAPPGAKLWQRALAIGWLSFFAHFKFVLCLEAVAAVAITSAIHALERRRRQALLQSLAFLVAYIGWWLAAGQNLGNLPRFWSLSWEISSGYSWGMAADPTTLVLVAGLIVLCSCGAFVGLIWRSDRTRFQCAGASLIVAAVWLLAWKQGFTRADQHTFGFFVAALLLGLALPGIFQPARRLCWQDLNAGLCIWGASTVGASLLMVGPQMTWFRWSRYPHAITHLAEWQSNFGQGVREAEAAARNPALQATIGRSTVDLLTFEQGLIFLNGLNYQPRPVLQSYSAYTPALAAANARFFQSERAPEFVIVRLNTVDGRYPGQDDALALAEFVRSYDVALAGGAFTLLRRKSPAPLPQQLVRAPLGQPVPFYGREIAVPDGRGHPIWIEIDFRPTWLGRLRAFFYHAIPPVMTVRLKDGGEEGFRIIPTTSRKGFFLQPLLHDHSDVAQLLHGHASRWAETIRLDVDGALSSWFWRRPHVQFFAFPELSLQQAPLLDTLVEVGAVNVRPLSAEAAASIGRLQIDGHALIFAHAQSEMILPVPAGTGHFSGGCGLLNGAYTAPNHTDGADFSVEADMADGARRTLWQRTLEPTTEIGDRGFRSFSFDVPAGATRLRLRIGPGRRNDPSWDWTFWGDLKLLP